MSNLGGAIGIAVSATVALITSSSLASAIFSTFSHRTKTTTTRSERTYRCRRTRRFGVMCAEQGACARRRATPSICSSLNISTYLPSYS
jgi:hypothetical protein